MKKVILLCGTLLALTATVALAAPGTNIRWNACFGDGGALNKAFACNTNTGTNVLVGSIVLAADIPQASGQEVVVDFASAGATLPAWWAFKNTGTCRQGSLALNTTISLSAANCFDWAINGPATGGIGAYNIGARGANTARMVAAIAVAGDALADMTGGTEYFLYNLSINNAKTTGLGACAGCQTPVCIVYNSNKITTQIPANNRVVSGPTNGTDSNFATWQGGAGVQVGQVTGCPAATPTKSTTWGSVKSLYR